MDRRVATGKVWRRSGGRELGGKRPHATAPRSYLRKVPPQSRSRHLVDSVLTAGVESLRCETCDGTDLPSDAEASTPLVIYEQDEEPTVKRLTPPPLPPIEARVPKPAARWLILLCGFFAGVYAALAFISSCGR